MEININQKKISFGDKYRIFTDGIPTHTASRRLFRWLPEVDLFDINGGDPKIRINKRFAFFKARYDIIRDGYNVLYFTTRSLWKAHYQCESGMDRYDIYGHRGRKYSIYKNEVQVAWWDKDPVSWFAGDNYKIIADRDCDADLIISFCLVIDNFRSDNHDGKLLTIDVGRIGFQARPFNPHFVAK